MRPVLLFCALVACCALLAGCGSGGLSQAQVDGLNSATAALEQALQRQALEIGNCPASSARLLTVCIDQSLKTMSSAVLKAQRAYRQTIDETNDNGCRQALEGLKSDVDKVASDVAEAKRLADAHRWSELRSLWSQDPLPGAAAHEQAVKKACHLQ